MHSLSQPQFGKNQLHLEELDASRRYFQDLPHSAARAWFGLTCGLVAFRDFENRELRFMC